MNDHTSPVKVDQYLQDLKAELGSPFSPTGRAVDKRSGRDPHDLCHDAGVHVEATPGPSAVINAYRLADSSVRGLSFWVPGSETWGHQKKLAVFADSPMTLVLFESPHRFETLLKQPLKR